MSKPQKLLVRIDGTDNDGQEGTQNFKLPTKNDWCRNLQFLNKKIAKKMQTDDEYGLLINDCIVRYDDGDGLSEAMTNFNFNKIPHFKIVDINLVGNSDNDSGKREIIIHFNDNQCIFKIPKELNELKDKTYDELLECARNEFKIKGRMGKIYENVDGEPVYVDDWEDLMEYLEDAEDDQPLLYLEAAHNDNNPMSNIVVVTTEPRNAEPNNESNELNSLDIVNSNNNDSEELYENMFNDIVPELEVKEEQKDQILALEVYGIQCEEKSCRDRCHPTHIFFCKHADCKDDYSLYCERCMRFKHERKSHKFHPNARHIKCANDFLNQNQSFNHNKEKGSILVKWANVKKVLFHHRWSWCAVSKVLITAPAWPAPIVNGLLARATPLVVNGVLTGTVGGVGGAAIGFAVETIYIWRQYKLKRISREAALQLTQISFASNTVAGITFLGVMAFGAAVGSPLGPIGMTACAVIAAILFGVAVRFGLNKVFEDKLKKKNDPQNDEKLQELALEYFFGKKNYDINDKDKFSEEILRKRYHRFALNAHPDRYGGDSEEWLKLSAYYGILIGIWENKNSKQADISTADDLSYDQRSLITNAEIKSAICSH